MLLPCAGGDIGLQWAYAPFGDGAMLHRATMKCLEVDGGSLALGSCADPPAAGQQWALDGSRLCPGHGRGQLCGA